MFLDEDFWESDENDHLDESDLLATASPLTSIDNVQTQQQSEDYGDDVDDLDHLRNYDSDGSSGGGSSDDEDDRARNVDSGGGGSGGSGGVSRDSGRSLQSGSARRYLNLSAHCMFIENLHPHRKINNAYIMTYLRNFSPKSAKRVYRDSIALDRAIVEFHLEADMLDCIRQLGTVDRAPLNPCSKIRVRVATQHDRRLFIKSGRGGINKKKRRRRKNKTHNEDTMLKRNDYSLQELRQIHAKRDAESGNELHIANIIQSVQHDDGSSGGDGSNTTSPVRERRVESVMEILRQKRIRARNLDLVVQVLQSRVYNPQEFEQAMESLLDAASNTNRTEVQERGGRLSNDDSEWVRQFVLKVRRMDNGEAERNLITSQAELQQQQ